MGYSTEQKNELYYASAILEAMKHEDVIILRYPGEIDVVKKALRDYINEIESAARGR